MAVILHPDGRIEPIGEALTLAVMERIVGGCPEFVFVGGTARDRHVLIVNDTGLRAGLPMNARATVIYQGFPPRTAHPIVGTVIECRCLDPGLDTERWI